MAGNKKTSGFTFRRLRSARGYAVGGGVRAKKKRVFIRRALPVALIQLLLPAWLAAQQVAYSPLPGYNARSTSFEVIGKYDGRRLIYTANYGDRRITFFDAAMRPVDTIVLDDLPGEVSDLHFIELQSGFIMLYQYEHRRDIICKAVLYDGNGTRRRPPLLIDKIRHPLRVVGDVAYSHVASEDKSRILIYKIIRRPEDDLLTLSTFLLDSSLKLLHRGQVVLPRSAAEPGPAQIRLSCAGGLYLLYGKGDAAYQPYFENIMLFYKPPFVDKAITKSIFFKDHLPGNHVLLTIDEQGEKLWLNTFNFDDRQRHFISLSTWQLGMDSLQVLQQSTQAFKARTRRLFADKRSRRKAVFDRYVPRKLVFSRSGAALLVGEKQFTDGEGHPHYGDIGFFNLDEHGDLVLVQHIAKEADEYSHPFLGSFLLINRGKALHILLNMSHSVTRFLRSSIYLLRDYRYLGNRELQPMPVMEKLDKGYQWLPSLGKQVARNEVVIPCLAGGNLLFGSITY